MDNPVINYLPSHCQDSPCPSDCCGFCGEELTYEPDCDGEGNGHSYCENEYCAASGKATCYECDIDLEDEYSAVPYKRAGEIYSLCNVCNLQEVAA